MVTGGATGPLHIYNSSMLNINGGVSGMLGAFNDTTVNLTYGTVNAGADIYNNSTLTITGGNITGVINDTSTAAINMSGGTAAEINLGDGAIFNLSGGTVSNLSEVSGSAHLNIFGAGLSYTIVPGGAGRNLYYSFTGTLDDGSSLNGFTIEASGTSSFSLISTPEPSAWFPLASGMAGCLFCYRRRSRGI